MSDSILEAFLHDIADFLGAIRIADIPAAMARADHVILEGAQGLLLDQDHRFFPHVTRSKTGLRNAAMLAREAGIDRLRATYMIRAYATRHGAGPLPRERPGKPFDAVRDDTNIPNPWQGGLRFGDLDLDLLAQSINTDRRDRLGIDTRSGLVVTCLDQVDAAVRIYRNGAPQEVPPDLLPRLAAAHCGLNAVGGGWGPTRQTIRLEDGVVRTGGRLVSQPATMA